MIDSVQGTWIEMNQRYMTASLARLASRIDHAPNSESFDSFDPSDLSSGMSVPPALERLTALFGLTRFEREIVLLCAGIELDSEFAAAVARRSGNTGEPKPTFSLFMSVLDEPHWSAITPAGTLRRWSLIEIGDSPTLTGARLRISERVLHYLTGCQYLDEDLSGLIKGESPDLPLAHAQLRIATTIERAWTALNQSEKPPVVQLLTTERDVAHGIVHHAAHRLGMQTATMDAGILPADPGACETFVRRWERESILGARVLVLDCTGVDTPSPGSEQLVKRFLERVVTPVVVVTPHTVLTRRRSLQFDVPDPDELELTTIWQRELSRFSLNLNGAATRVTGQFRLDPAGIRAVCSDLSVQLPEAGDESTEKLVWDLCRERVRPKLDRLAQRIEAAAGWEDLVLPPSQIQTLQDVVKHVRQRHRVYNDWGFAERGTRGLGISALFAGPSGTGKTMASEVLARELNLDLYRIDLSQIVSKYIGETEKNLSRLFDAAEGCRVMLLFDEADALFGKRSEVRDSHDRYANIEVSYLLQRMETYNGLAILTTNLKNALDQAFHRRIRFVVQFPFPDAAARAEIWRRIFPARTPLRDVDFEKLSQFSVSGGNIRNIAMNAAFLAADDDELVNMRHLLQSARSEAAKLERPISDAEVRGWDRNE